MSQPASLPALTYSVISFLGDLAKARGMEFDLIKGASKAPTIKLTRPIPEWKHDGETVQVRVTIEMVEASWVWLLRRFEIRTIPRYARVSEDYFILQGERLLGFYNKKMAPEECNPNMAMKRYWNIGACKDLIALLRSYDEIAEMTGHLPLFTK